MKIVNFAPTGSIPTRENSLAPLTANEIIDEVQMMYEYKLITLVHIHARDFHLKNTYKTAYFQPIIEGIRKHCPDLAICTSLSGRHTQNLKERMEVLELEPDMGSLTLGSWNYSSGVNVNTPDNIVTLANRMLELGIVPELECFDTGMINYAKYLINKGILRGPHYMNVIFGNLSNVQIHEAEHVMSTVPSNAKVCFGGIGPVQYDATRKGMQIADGCRVGLEDNLYIGQSKVRATNYLLVKEAVGNNEVLSPKEFKKWLQS
jgi:hypothetical protein